MANETQLVRIQTASKAQSNPRPSLLRLSALFFLGIVLVLSGAVVEGALIVVNGGDDWDVDGVCSLREAIHAANTNTAVDSCPAGNSSGMDFILILTTGTITVAGSSFTVTENLEIGGPGADALTIDGGYARRIFDIDMAISAHDFTLRQVTLKNGREEYANGGAVRLTNVDLAFFERVDFVDNFAVEGGAIGIPDTLGAVRNTIKIGKCRFVGNHATEGGGALAVGQFSNNVFGGANLEITGSLFQRNTAALSSGAIFFGDSLAHTVEIKSSSFLGNGSNGNVGAVRLLNGADVPPAWVIENSTFAGNSSQSIAGALHVDRSDVTVLSSTFWRNGSSTGCNNFYVTIGTVSLGHTVLGEPAESASSQNACCGVNGGETRISLGYNLAPDTSCALYGSGDIQGSAAKLAGVGATTGSTPAAVPAEGSPLIDGGNPAGCVDGAGDPLLVDQRGDPRPVDGDGVGGAVCDIGAVEVEQGTMDIFFDGFETANTWLWSTSVSQ